MSDLIELSREERANAQLALARVWEVYPTPASFSAVVDLIVGAVNEVRRGVHDGEPRVVLTLGVGERVGVWIDRHGDEWRWYEPDENWQWRFSSDEEWIQPSDEWVSGGVLSARFGPFRRFGS